MLTEYEYILAIILFGFSYTITPGPNNLMLLASGVNFGVRATYPHLGGIVVGVIIVFSLAGFGVAALLISNPGIANGLKIASFIYLLYLSWKIATGYKTGDKFDAVGADGISAQAKPLSMVAACLFQLINPKVWIGSITSIAIYANTHNAFFSILTIGMICIMAGFISNAIWLVLGQLLRQWIASPIRRKYFNLGMGFVLALTAVILFTVSYAK